MRVADLVTATMLILLGGVVLFDSLRLGIGWGTDGPKSGFFPFWLAFLMVMTCGAILVQTLRTAQDKPFVTREQLTTVLQVLVPALGLVVLIQFIGLYVASAIYMAFYMRWVGRHSWLTVLVMAIGIPVATFVIFERWFLVAMPKGPLEAWLGY